jgi:hypothetical protein
LLGIDFQMAGSNPNIKRHVKDKPRNAPCQGGFSDAFRQPGNLPSASEFPWSRRFISSLDNGFRQGSILLNFAPKREVHGEVAEWSKAAAC